MGEMWILLVRGVFVVTDGVDESDGGRMCGVYLQEVGRLVEECEVVLYVGRAWWRCDYLVLMEMLNDEVVVLFPLMDDDVVGEVESGLGSFLFFS